MITYTIQIEFSADKHGLSIAGALAGRGNRHPMEDYAGDVLHAAVGAAQQFLVQQCSSKGAHVIEGGESLVDLVKQRLENSGLKFKGSPFEQAFNDWKAQQPKPKKKK